MICQARDTLTIYGFIGFQFPENFLPPKQTNGIWQNYNKRLCLFRVWSSLYRSNYSYQLTKFWWTCPVPTMVVNNRISKIHIAHIPRIACEPGKYSLFILQQNYFASSSPLLLFTLWYITMDYPCINHILIHYSHNYQSWQSTLDHIHLYCSTTMLYFSLFFFWLNF